MKLKCFHIIIEVQNNVSTSSTKVIYLTALLAVRRHAFFKIYEYFIVEPNCLVAVITLIRPCIGNANFNTTLTDLR